jgi:hypothetical protein
MSATTNAILSALLVVTTLVGMRAIAMYRADASAVRRRVLYALGGRAGVALSALQLADRLVVRVGRLYPILRQLEHDDVLRSWEVPGGAERGYRPRRLYALKEPTECDL